MDITPFLNLIFICVMGTDQKVAQHSLETLLTFI